MKPKPPKSYRGQLLLDSGQLTGSFFHRAVVLICQHDEQGAFGLVLNRGTGKTVGEALAAEAPAAVKKQPLFLGGPVQTTALSYLHSDDPMLNPTVMPNLSLGHDLESLTELGESISKKQKLRLFAGYAGWTANQLEGEIERGAWLIHPASLDLVFKPRPHNLWREILRGKKEWKYRLLSEMPDDLSWN